MNLLRNPRLQALADELRSNPRLKIGLCVIALILLYGTWVTLDDLHKSTLRALGDVRGELTRVEGLAGQDVWVDRAEGAAELLASLRAEIPDATSTGLAQAAFQSWLSGLLSSMPSKIQMSLEPGVPVEMHPELIRVGATISGALSTRQVLDLIKRIESERSLIVISAIQIRNERMDTFSLTTHAYYRLNATENVARAQKP